MIEKQRVFPSLFRVEKGKEEKRKRGAINSSRQGISALNCLITNVINLGKTPVI